MLPQGLDPNLWDVLLHNAIVPTVPKDILHAFRLLRTVLFLCRLCHDGAQKTILLFGGVLDQSRTENAMEIAENAEKLLASEPDHGIRAHPHIVSSIIEHGSWADDLTRQLWAGLLATSCTGEGTDQSNNAFVDLLMSVTHTQCRIFVAGCTKALEHRPETEVSPSGRIVLTHDQLIRVTDVSDVSRNATDIASLFNCGIIEKNFNYSSYLPAERIDITPSSLGMELFNRGKGHCIKHDLPLDALGGA